MSAPRNRKHIVVPIAPQSEDYRPHPKKIVTSPIEGPSNRRKHAQQLRASLEEAVQQTQKNREALNITIEGAEPGLYIQFESPPDIDLKLESLEDQRKGIELVAVRQIQQKAKQPPVQLATVFVPDKALKHFFDRFKQYEKEKTPNGEPRHKDSIDRIANLRKATLRALWTDAIEAYPKEKEVIWWEVWLRRHDGHELQRILDFSELRGLLVSERRLSFDDRIVILVKGDIAALSASLDVLSDFAEVRKAKETSAFFVDSPVVHQAEWVKDLKQRVTQPDENAPTVCILDTGVTHDHPLLKDIIDPSDAMAVNPAWLGHDDGGGRGNMGHGTEMAGLAAYGDLVSVLISKDPIHMRHRLESVKILPPKGNNDPDLYGAITAQAVTRPEIKTPLRARVFSLAVTATDERDRGQPTSWSAALDALAAGRTFDPTTQGLVYLDKSEPANGRLFVVSAGNVDPDNLQTDHLARSDVDPVHDPAHAWNTLAVGAFTEKTLINGKGWEGWNPLAKAGDLSPWSTTSVAFQDEWPVKPDVVFEGANVAHKGKDFDCAVPDLCLLTTHYKPAEKPFALIWATSAATAQVARMAAIVRADYPQLWPETVRALIIHSAEWTKAMHTHFSGAGGKKRARAKLVRRYGFGVPHIERALRSANDSLTLVVQGTIHPFSEGKMREMHLYELPWPKEILESLGPVAVRLKVTLSYFIEPNPGRRGWLKRHRYASHGLRFDLKQPTEDVTQFRKRLNQQALDDDEDKPSNGDNTSGWYLGDAVRKKGSIHSDIWTGTAADLAERGVIGIYPVSGWWKDQPKRDRSEFGARYALVIGIETKAEDVDIWTPVAQAIGVPIEEIDIDL